MMPKMVKRVLLIARCREGKGGKGEKGGKGHFFVSSCLVEVAHFSLSLFFFSLFLSFSFSISFSFSFSLTFSTTLTQLTSCTKI